MRIKPDSYLLEFNLREEEVSQEGAILISHQVSRSEVHAKIMVEMALESAYFKIQGAPSGVREVRSRVLEFPSIRWARIL